MIAVDSGVWIDYFRGVENPASKRLDLALGSQLLAIGDLSLVEVLQGLRDDRHFEMAKSHLLHLVVLPLLGKELALRCAGYIRALRERGVAAPDLGKSLVATFCIVNELPLLHSDRRFDPFVEHLGLVPV